MVIMNCACMVRSTALKYMPAGQPHLCGEFELVECVAGLVILEQLLPELKAQDADTLLYPSALKPDDLLLCREVPSLHLLTALQALHPQARE